ncbi:hypothetical protein SFR_0027 [Streptomyces sp. FR-008]|nr:hypothetical protein SFR_0027 [Streptomyces sp. FR-008]
MTGPARDDQVSHPPVERLVVTESVTSAAWYPVSAVAVLVRRLVVAQRPPASSGQWTPRARGRAGAARFVSLGFVMPS